jgi:hypothetical protein
MLSKAFFDALPMYDITCRDNLYSPRTTHRPIRSSSVLQSPPSALHFHATFETEKKPRQKLQAIFLISRVLGNFGINAGLCSFKSIVNGPPLPVPNLPICRESSVCLPMEGHCLPGIAVQQAGVQKTDRQHREV